MSMCFRLGTRVLLRLRVACLTHCLPLLCNACLLETDYMATYVYMTASRNILPPLPTHVCQAKHLRTCAYAQKE